MWNNLKLHFIVFGFKIKTDNHTPNIRKGKFFQILIVSFIDFVVLALSRETWRDRPSSRSVSWRRCSRATRCADSSRVRTIRALESRASRLREMETTLSLPTPLDPLRSTRYHRHASCTRETRVCAVSSLGTLDLTCWSTLPRYQRRPHGVAVMQNFSVALLYAYSFCRFG